MVLSMQVQIVLQKAGTNGELFKCFRFLQVNPKSTLFYIILATVVSTLFAMYGLVVMVKATEEILKKHRIRMKFLVLQLVLICTNLQSAILAIFNRFDLPPCRGAIGSKVRGSSKPR